MLDFAFYTMKVICEKQCLIYIALVCLFYLKWLRLKYTNLPWKHSILIKDILTETFKSDLTSSSVSWLIVTMIFVFNGFQ